ncbi:MAG: single-stranded-DNA-specific exonuclease RecJ [Burkholderiales bacterium]|nr:single-stranded-DNA-specific exonuclease RecJ [Burkholderiales bacterium]
MSSIVTRPIPQRARDMLVQQGLHPVLAQLYAARGVLDKSEVQSGFSGLIAPERLQHADRAAALLADAIQMRQRLLIVADYDCDGATACAVGVRALRAFGADVAYLVPNRFEYGYGLTPEIVELAAHQPRRPDLLITVDNGIASNEGVARANAFGIATLITDHHLPGVVLPQATCIVNPNQPGCDFPSKAIAGVGVMFYVMLALRAELRRRGWFALAPLKEGGTAGGGIAEFNLATLLDLVALGTVADVVRLDRNNRILVAQGLARIRAGKMQAGIAALLRVAGREAKRASCFDLGFAAGPRLNAAGRLADMALGIECLITDDRARALNIAQELDRLNRERREIEGGMQEQALAMLEGLGPAAGAEPEAAAAYTRSLYDPSWHQGVVGILAARIKDRLHRPVIAFAAGTAGELKGSGRSIPGLHLRDALDLVTKRAPGLILRFGGHAAAAGLTIRSENLAQFSLLFESSVRSLLAASDLARSIETDGPLESAYMNLDTIRLLEREVWGQGFPQPLFCDRFAVASQRIVADRHLKLRLQKDGKSYDAIRFNSLAPAGAAIRAAYRLAVNEYNGVQSVQLIVEEWESAA